MNYHKNEVHYQEKTFQQTTFQPKSLSLHLFTRRQIGKNQKAGWLLFFYLLKFTFQF